MVNCNEPYNVCGRGGGCLFKGKVSTRSAWTLLARRTGHGSNEGTGSASVRTLGFPAST